MAVAVPIPESTRDLFERPILCALSSMNPDGQPHTVPVWCNFDGTNVRVNCPAATRKARNMAVGSKVTVLLLDQQSAFHRNRRRKPFAFRLGRNAPLPFGLGH
jgi:Pyridoxamine 5'-phosphate oxidase